MSNNEPNRRHPALIGMRLELAEAEDEKIRRIVALLDQQASPNADAILSPLRPRLGALRLPRPLRFDRLLFLPCNPLIVPTPGWRPGDPTIPRGALLSIARIVRAGLGPMAEEIDHLIAGQSTAAEAVITLTGDRLWPRAADILALVPSPLEWEATGLPATTYPNLARAIAAVLRRAPRLRGLVQDTAVGAVIPGEGAIHGLMGDIAVESPEGCGMVVALILGQLPNAATLLRRLLGAGRGATEKLVLRQALDAGVDCVLTDMEGPSGFAGGVSRAPLSAAGSEVRRITALLGDIENESDSSKHRPRLREIRIKLDQACRARFTAGLTDDLVTPLAISAGPVGATAQTQFEDVARDLRALESAARRVSGAGIYDSLLDMAAKAVQVAAAAGVLTPMRKLRLVEILAGPEAAEAMYHQDNAVRRG